MVEAADAAAGDHRDADGVGNGADELDVEALAGAVAVDRGQQDLAGTKSCHLCRKFHGVEPGRAAPAMGQELEARRRAGSDRHPLGIDGDDDALGAEFAGGRRRPAAGR